MVVLGTKINVDNLRGEVIRDNETYIVEDNTFLTNLTVSKTTLYPGKQTGGHSHRGLEEVYTFVKGTGIMIIDQQEQECAPGDIFMIPDGSFHQVRNTGDVNLEFICVFQKYEREENQ